MRQDPEELRAEAAALEDEAVRAESDAVRFMRALAPAGIRHSGTEGPKGLAEAHSRLTDAFEQIAPKLVDAKPKMVEAIGKAAELAAEGLPEDEAARVWEIAARAADLPGYRDIEVYFGTIAKRYDERAGGVGPACLALLHTIRTTLANANPAYASRIQALNRAREAVSGIQPSARGASAARFIFNRGHS